jgi:hypothetical protein
LSPVANAVRSALFGAGMGLVACGAHGASIEVTSPTDDGVNCTLREALGAIDNGIDQNGCTNASATPFGTNDTITFQSSGNILLTGMSELAVNKDLVIDASSVGGVTINALQSSRVFNIAGSLAVTLDHLTVTGGSTGLNGGGIFIGSESELTIVDSTITSNKGGSYGGGLYVGPYTKTEITDSQFSSNVSDQDGGGMYFASTSQSAYEPTTVTLTNTSVTGNTASGDQGGGIWSYGYANVVSLIDSVVDNNTASTQGGGVYSIGENSKLTIVGGSVDNNRAGSQAGGMYIGSFDKSFTANLESTSVSGNSSGLGGGGIAIHSGGLYGGASISESTPNLIAGSRNYKTAKRLLSSNNSSTGRRANGNLEKQAQGRDISVGASEVVALMVSEVSLQMTDTNVNQNSAGGITIDYAYGGGILAKSVKMQMTRGRVTGNDKGYYGGGIAGFDSEITLLDATISGNSSIGDGAGMYTSDSTVTLTNSTVSGNYAGRNGDHEGGGIWSSGGYLSLDNSTVSGNSVYYSGGGIWSTGITTLTNTTVSDNTTGYAAGGIKMDGASLSLLNTIVANSVGGDDCVASQSTSVTSDVQSIVEDASCGSARSGDPGLMPLNDNGGLTKTHAPNVNSIAVNSGDNLTCLQNDQRGQPRSDGRCDVGSVELEETNFIVIRLANGKVAVVPN